MPGNVHYVSMLVYNFTGPNDIDKRIDWLRQLLYARFPLTLFIDSQYYAALFAASWFSIENHPELRLIPWHLDDSETWRRILSYSSENPLRLPEFRDAVKDSEFFMALMNAKTELVAAAAATISEPFVAFVDAGIGKVFKNVKESFGRLRDLEIRKDFSGVLIPGCLEPAPLPIELLASRINWTFCGGFFLVPRREARELFRASVAALSDFVRRGWLTWEVNVWVHMAQAPEAPKMCWFAADHNDSMTKVPAKYLASYPDTYLPGMAAAVGW